MSFLDCYLPYFRQWLLISPLPAFCLSSLCLLKVCKEISSLPLPSSLVLSAFLPPLLFDSF
jgi:hypothetical protein